MTERNTENKLKWGDYLYFDCVALPYYLLKIKPEAWDKVKVGNECSLERDLENEAGDRNAVQVYHEDYTDDPLGYVERDWKTKVATLVDYCGWITCRIVEKAEHYVTMCFPLDEKKIRILQTVKPMRYRLQKSYLASNLIIGEPGESHGLHSTVNKLLCETRPEKILKYANDYLDKYGKSVSGEDEKDYIRVLQFLQNLDNETTRQQGEELGKIVAELKEVHRHMTKGDNIIKVYQHQYEQFVKKAKKSGGLYSRLCGMYFKDGEPVSRDEVGALQIALDKWLRKLFRNTYFSPDKGMFATNMFYAELSNEELRIVFTHVLAYEFLTSVLDANVNGQQSTVNGVNENVSNEKLAILDNIRPIVDGLGRYVSAEWKDRYPGLWDDILMNEKFNLQMQNVTPRHFVGMYNQKLLCNIVGRMKKENILIGSTRELNHIIDPNKDVKKYIDNHEEREGSNSVMDKELQAIFDRLVRRHS